MRCLSSSIFFFLLQWVNLIGPSLKKIKMKLWWLLQVEGSILKYRVLTLWPTYRSERRTTFIKACGKKWSAIENSLGNMLGLGNSLLWPSLPHIENKTKQNNLSSKVHSPSGKSPLPPSHKKKGRTFHSMAQLLVGCMEILFLKLAAPIFGLD